MKRDRCRLVTPVLCGDLLYDKRRKMEDLK